MDYTDATVDHITIGGTTKYYEDREARANLDSLGLYVDEDGDVCQED